MDEEEPGRFSSMKTPSLIDQLQKLLEQYSDEQILKELIQNAEDGGAKTIKVLYADQSHQVPTPAAIWRNNPIQFAMREPALCVYNDGIFTEKDWEGIAALQCSTKEDDPLKVGRFGLGFKSVFHITDTPVIISGKNLMVINPAMPREYAVYCTELRSIRNDDQDIMINVIHNAFDFSKRTFEVGYTGTLFWFPLRYKASNLSIETYNYHKIKDIFLGLKALAPSLLIFLTSVECIEIYETKHQTKHQLFTLKRTKIQTSGLQRREFLSKVEGYKGKLSPSSMSSSSRYKIIYEGFDWMQQRKQEDDWLIVSYYQGLDVGSKRLKQLLSEKDWPYNPYVSIGVCLNREIQHGYSFCFLPLSLEDGSSTGLPVHLNGYFALSPDRHHIKQAAATENIHRGHVEKSVEWNQILLNEILSYAYKELILLLTKENSVIENRVRVYTMLPKPSVVSQDCQRLVQSVYNHLLTEKFIFTNNGMGQWITPLSAIFESENASITVEDIFILCGQNIAIVPDFIIQLLEKHVVCVTPILLRKEMVSNAKTIYTKLTIKQKLKLLHFFLHHDMNCLENLELLPLSDGTSFIRFCHIHSSNLQDVIYMCNHRADVNMFPNMSSCFSQPLDTFHPDQRMLMQEIAEKEISQLRLFQPEHFTQLIKRCSKINNLQSLPFSDALNTWLCNIWNYISKYKIDVMHLQHLPLLPVLDSTRRLERLDAISIVSSIPGIRFWDVNIVGALQKLGIVVFSTLPHYIPSYVLGRFVQFPSDEGLVHCMERILQARQQLHPTITLFNNSCTPIEKRAFLEKLNSIDERQISAVKVLIRKLNLFCETNLINLDTSLDAVNIIYENSTGFVIPVELAIKTIHCKDEYSKQMAIKCGAKLVSFYEIVQQIINNIRSYSSGDIKKFMDFFLSNISWFIEHTHIIHAARNVNFVENRLGKFYRPLDLVKPDSMILQTLFTDEDEMFPAKHYESQLPGLLILGLRNENNITDSEIMNSAQNINDRLKIGTSQMLYHKANGLWIYLSKYGTRLSERTVQQLSFITWCPIANHRPVEYPDNLPFAGENNKLMLCKPCELFDIKYASVVGGANYLTIATTPECLIPYILKPERADSLAMKQLFLISESYSGISNTHNQFMNILMTVYDFLQSSGKAFKVDDYKIVWTGSIGRFQQPKHVWIQNTSLDLDLQPYRYPLADEFRFMGDWFQSIGCLHSQTVDMLINILESIQSKHESECIISNDETERDFSLVTRIIDTLANSHEDKSDKMVLLPIRTDSKWKLRLKPSSECTICNQTGLYELELLASVGELQTIFVVHENISVKTAKRFNVLDFKERVLKHAETFDMNYGQREPLTTRIKNLLKDYTDGVTITKELIQNADDAGASKVKFVYDERVLPAAQSCLIHEAMKTYQGPAFWAYNDAKFTDEDIKNIKALGGATKESDNLKIGRFGLGFNSVYNMTDVPSLLSGDTYIIFDPHETHIGTSGMMVKLNNHLLRQRIIGHFVPFENMFGCKICNSDTVVFNGTIFRLPLRNEEAAVRSEIKKLNYSKIEMKKFISKIVECSGNLLLFTQNVKEIELYHLESNSDEPKLLMSVFKSSNHERGAVKLLTEMISEANEDFQYQEELHIKLSTTIFLQQLCDIPLLDHTVPFVVCWSFGRNKLLKAAKQLKVKGLLPLAATALSKTGKHVDIRGFYDTSHLFCFLPLPIVSHLPVHINASFALQSSRRDLVWANEDDLQQCPEHKWNKLLLEDAGCQSYIMMLNLFARLLPSKCFDVWPIIALNPKHDRIISICVYRQICEGNFAVFPSIKRKAAVCLKQIVFLDPCFRDEHILGNIAYKAIKYFMENDNLTVVDLSSNIYQQFKIAGCELFLEAQMVSIADFFRNIVLQFINHNYWSEEELDQLLLFALFKEDVRGFLLDHECVPTEPNGKRKRPQDLVHPKGPVSELFSIDEERFPRSVKRHIGSFQSPKALKYLQSLGMITDTIVWDNLSKRLIVAIETCDPVFIRNRSFHFLTYFSNNNRYQLCPQQIVREISKLEFLPEWKQQHKFISPSRAFHPDLHKLVEFVSVFVDIESLQHIQHVVYVLKQLGVKISVCDVSLNLVIDNMLQLKEHHKHSSSKDSVFNFDSSFMEIYEFLNHIVKSQNKENIQMIVTQLRDQTVILNHEHLVAPSVVMVELKNNLSPYLFMLEYRLRKFHDLFNVLGVNDHVQRSRIVSILLDISFAKGEQQLTEDDLSCMVNLGTEFVGLPQQEDLIGFSDIKLPNERGCLVPTRDLYYDDVPWIKSRLHSANRVHQKFSPEVSKQLGVKSKRNLDISKHTMPLYSNFGQHQKLTNRIKRILEGYPCDESILKEFLQNADDAGATELIIIKDFRHLPCKTLPDDRLKNAQGPALCIFNDAYFTDGDIQGIQDIGLGSKHNELLTTGHYGVGFNVVYHITDIPSFWSKDQSGDSVVCMFDPDCNYAPVASDACPGVRINVMSEDMKQYADFMAGYIPSFTTKIKQGTLFRLPLRSELMASRSTIKNNITTKTDVKEMVEKFKTQIFSCMLFLENIKTVKIASVVDNIIKVEYEVTSHMNINDKHQQDRFNTHVEHMSDRISENIENAMMSSIEISINVQLKDSDKLERDYIIVKRCGFEEHSNLVQPVQVALYNGEIKKMPRGGTAIRLSNAIEERGHAFCTLPLPLNTGLPIHINGNFILGHESRRNLWTGNGSIQNLWNVAIGTHVIVPAYISALKHYKHYILMKNNVSKRTKASVTKLIKQYESMFPNINNTTDIYWKNLSTQVYQFIAKHNECLFPVVGDSKNKCEKIEWVSVQTSDNVFSGCFNTLWEYFKQRRQEIPLVYRSASVSRTPLSQIPSTSEQEGLEHTLIKLNFKVLRSSLWILEQFKTANVAVETITPYLILQFLKSKQCNVGHLPAVINETGFGSIESLKRVLEFILKDLSEDENVENLDCLYDTPLLLKQNNTVHVFKRNQSTILSKFCGILPEHSSAFISIELVEILGKHVKTFGALTNLTMETFVSLIASSEDFRDICSCHYTTWNPKKKIPVSVSWLAQVWMFIGDQVSQVQGRERELFSLQTFLTPLLNMCILPVKRGNEFRLVPLKDACSIIQYSFAPDLNLKKIHAALRSLPLWELYCPATDYLNYIACDMVARIEESHTIVELLHNNRALLETICKTNGSDILKYLNTNCHILKQYPDHLAKVKNFKIFPSIDGSLVSINKTKQYVILNDPNKCVPPQGIQRWSELSGVVILTHNFYFLDIYSYIGVKKVSPHEIYVNHILPNFIHLEQTDHICHLEALRDKVLMDYSSSVYNELVEQMKLLQFIPVENDKLHRACHFFDKDISVFEVMCSPSQFLPSPFNNQVWRTFMITSGFVIKVTENMLVQFAESVQEHACNDGITQTLLRQSHELVKHLYKHYSHVSEQNEILCQRIRQLRFVDRFKLEQKDVKIRIHKQFGCSNRFIAFQDSYTNTHSTFIWTVGNIIYLPTYFPKKMLAIKDQVCAVDFIKNMENVCRFLQDSINLQSIEMSELTNIFEEFYQFILDNVDNISDLKCFKNILIPDAAILVAATRVLIKPQSGNTIKNYIFEAPSIFGKYFDVFKALGARDAAEPDMYLEVLREIYTDNVGIKLNPNDIDNVKKCIEQLVILWENGNQYPMVEPVLYLPDDELILADSTELVYRDNVHLVDKITRSGFRYFIGYNKLHILDTAFYSHQYWPERYRMKELSKLLREVVNPECLLDADESHLASELRRRCLNVMSGLLRLMFHDQKLKRKPLIKEDDVAEKKQAILELRVLDVDILKFDLIHDTSSGIAGVLEKQTCFIRDSKNPSCYILYLNRKLISVDEIEVMLALTEIFNEILCTNIDKYFPYIWKMHINEIETFLDSHEISKFDLQESRFSIIPIPGKWIPERYHWLIDFGFSEFKVGEFVVYQQFDPLLEDSLDEELDDAPDYIYAQIIDILAETRENEFARYRIDIGQDRVIDVNSTEIFRFRRHVTNGSTELVSSNRLQELHNVDNNEDEQIILAKIREVLTKAWKNKDLKVRNRVKMTLIFKWHPDKNPHNVALATRITQKILNYVDRLDKGKNLQDESSEDEVRKSNYSFYEHMNSRAKRHAEYSWEYRSREHFTSSSFHSEPAPRPREARRWLRQAICDLEAAEWSIKYGDDKYSWICYKCQQAGEKALKAIWHNIDSNKVDCEHDLKKIACGLPHSDITNIASKLQVLIGHHTKMRYPDQHSYPKIPDDVYSEDQSRSACQLTRQILNLASNFIAV